MTKPSRINRLTLLSLALCVGFVPLIVPAQNAPHRLSKDDVVKLLKGQVSPHRLGLRARQQGIDFEVTPDVERELRQAGATDELVATLLDLEPKAGQIVVQTSPQAELYLDDQYTGRTSAEGRLVIGNAKPGEHKLRVSLAGKKNFEQKTIVLAGQTVTVQATLVDLAGSIKVQTSEGAEVFLDNSRRGIAGLDGKLIVPEMAPGPHELRVTAQGKKDFRQGVTVLAGQEISVEARIESLGPTPGMVRVNPKDGLKYVWIPPGSFTMGCSPGDDLCGNDEKPAHRVGITKGIWMGQTPVTVAAYRRYSGTAGRAMPPAPPFNLGWNNQEMPIVNVSWDNADGYCTWEGGRLPTEAEWEYAARAGSTESRYGRLDEIAWYWDNSGSRAHEVAQKRPNAFYLYDMLGNVWEWVNDWYGKNYYSSSPERDPQGPKNGVYRVLRGGSWVIKSWDARVSYRVGSLPGYAYGMVLRGNYRGFRCVREGDIP